MIARLTPQKLAKIRMVGIVCVIGLILLGLLWILPIIHPQIDYYCFYCKGDQSGWGLFWYDFVPPSGGCRSGPNDQHSWAPITVYRLHGQGHTSFLSALRQIHAISMYLEYYKMDYGQYPTSEEGLSALKKLPACNRGWESLVRDPEGKPFHYRLVNGQYLIYSYGRDEKPGGHSRDADVVSTDW